MDVFGYMYRPIYGRLEMTMGMGFPMEMRYFMGISLDGNKTPIWEWEGVGMNVDGNGNDSYSHGEKFPRSFFSVVGLHYVVDQSTITDKTF